MISSKKKYLLFFIISTYTLISSQEIPPIQNFTAEDYNAENQNWDISQSKEKFIYVANNRGLLEFNGAKWHLYTSPNNSIVRSVKIINEKVYSGCYMEFGYWQKDQSGQLNYHSLSSELDIKMLEDEEFWDIIQLEEWILFQSLNRIYIYNSKTKNYKIINSKTALQKIFKVENTIYFQKLNDGIYKIEKGNTLLVSNDPTFKTNIIVGAFNHNKKLLLLTQENGFYTISNKKAIRWNTPSDKLLSTTSVYSSVKTTKNTFILGTISDGIYQLDKNGKTLSNVDQAKGLNNNTVLNVFEDLDKNIWAGLDNGISCLNYNSPFKVYNDKNGKLGTTYASAIHQNYLYVGTNQGLFYKRQNTNEHLQLINGTEGQVWNLQVIDNTLFCGHNLGTYIIDINQATLISNIEGTWKLLPFPNQKNKIIQGNYNGFSILSKKNNKWTFSHQIDGFKISSRYFELINKDKILVTHEHKGVYELILNKDKTKFTEIKINTKLKGEKSSIVGYQNNFLYYYNEGIFNYNTKTNSFNKDSILNDALTIDETYNSGKLVNSNDEKLWAFTNKNIVYFSPGKLNTKPEVTKIYLPVELRKDYTGFENISLLEKEKYLLGTSFGYLIIDTKKIKKKKHRINLTRITKKKLNNQEEPVNLKTAPLLNYKENNITFSYSVSSFEKFTEIQYKYILEGRHDHWSEWTKESQKAFENLPFGKYTFKTKAKTGNDESVNEIIYDFIIERPWYLSYKIIGIYLVIFLFAVSIIHNIYKQHYKKQKQSILNKKQIEFEHTQLENEKVIMKLRNDKLRSEIEGKNKELAASTMSIIKKNEFLNSIKKELLEFKDPHLIKPVIKIIDKNLNNTNDWKLFQEAFNNADKDFLTKAKDKYPQLTPSDLRLCAYLRLNLSSKEIAPLLNISHKSVEIKRYRLRKKMSLTKKDNLIHHILEI